MTFMQAFNLVDAPWIPCVPRGGSSPVPLSLHDTLVTAHMQRQVLDNSPLVTVALHRLLLSVLHRVFRGPRSVDDWRRMRAADQFDPVPLDTYLDTWRHRFDLFDRQHPFYQVPQMEGVEPVSAAKLAHEKASGNNVTLFDHSTAATTALTPAEAARYLVAFQAYAVGGGVSQPFNLSDAPLARDYTILMRGDSLFETLMLNLIRYTPEYPMPWLRDDDAPCWERETHPLPDKDGTQPDGYLDYLTWQSRRVHLILDPSTDVVRQCQIRQNLKLAVGTRDPFKAYQRSQERGEFARRFAVDRAIWRDAHALFEVAEDATQGSRPAIFDWIADVVPSGIGRQRGSVRQSEFDVLGYLTDGAQATVMLWRHDRLPLPFSYLTHQTLRARLRDAIQLAEGVSMLFKPGFGGGGKGQKRYPRPLRVLAEELLTGLSGRKPDSSDITDLVNHFGAERDYWAGMEPYFRRFMVTLAQAMATGGDDAGWQALNGWLLDVRQCARSVFSRVIGELDTSARSLRAGALAERAFNWQLGEVLEVASWTHPPDKEETE